MPYRLRAAIAASICALSFIVGMVFYLLFFSDSFSPSLHHNLEQQMHFLEHNVALIYVWYLIIYVLFGLSLLVLSQALFYQQAALDSSFAAIAYALALIWSGLVIAVGFFASVGIHQLLELAPHDPLNAKTLWLVVQIVIQALGGGNELIGGLWLMMVAAMGMKYQLYNRTLNLLALISGIAGCATLIPDSETLQVMFGLGSIVWLIGLSWHLASSSEPQISKRL